MQQPLSLVAREKAIFLEASSQGGAYWPGSEKQNSLNHIAQLCHRNFDKL